MWAARVGAVVLALVASRALAGPEALSPSILADIPEDARRTVIGSFAGSTPSSEEALDAVFQSAPAFRFASGPIVVRTDRRWFATAEAQPEEGTPPLVLRRWPGDSFAAFWILPTAGPGPPAAFDAAAGTLQTPLGEVAARWREREAVPGVRLAALLVAGDAGLGPEARGGLFEELERVWERSEVDPETAAAAAARSGAAALRPPPSATLPGPADERVDPWQSVSGNNFTLGLPPGLLARRTDVGVPPPVPLPGAAMWIRGRFADREGRQVAVGDGARAGYVAIIAAEALASWFEGSAPVGATGAKRVRQEAFHAAEELSGCAAARAERWSEPGFAGSWLVFRLRFDTRGIEIGLPVVDGRQSQALYWIPLLWRDAGRPPAPPPIDPAERFGITFDRLAGSDRRSSPWVEGYLTVPGLRLELPRGWWPVAALRSRDGFPVDLLGPEGSIVGRIEPAETVDLPADGSGWERSANPRRYGATAVWHKPDGESLFLGRDGPAIRVVPVDLSAESRAAWDRMLESALVPGGRTRPE